MLDPCSTSSYISENAAQELELYGQALILTIAGTGGTGGTAVKTRSRRVELTVTNVNSMFSSPLQAHVLDNIASNIPWSELKDRWPPVHHVPFENVSRRRQIDVMIGNDHPVFHRVLGVPHFLFLFLLRTVSSWSSKNSAKIYSQLFWQFHSIVRKEPLRVEQPTLNLNLFWSAKVLTKAFKYIFQVGT